MSEQDERAVALYQGEGDVVSGHALSLYGSSKIVRIFADRIMAIDDRKVRLNKIEAILTAQAAITTGLNPFPPSREMWSWVQQRGGRRVLTIMRHRDGSLKIAKDNAKKEGTYLYPPRFRQITDVAERERRMIPEGALAWEARVEDHASMTAWQATALTLKDLGYTKKEIDARIGDPPADIGLGIITADEIEALEWAHDDNGKRKFKLDVKYNHEERCKKRAFIAALRTRWSPQEFSPERGDLKDEDFAIEGEWTILPPEQTKTGEELHRAAQQGSETLYGGGMEGSAVHTKTPKRTPGRGAIEYWPDPVLKAMVEEKTAIDISHAVEILEKSPFNERVSAGAAIAYGKVFLSCLDQGMSTKKAHVEASARWQERAQNENEEPDEPRSPENVRKFWNSLKGRYSDASADQKRGKDMTLTQFLAWQLNECFAGDKDANRKRHSVLAYLTEGRIDSLKKLTGPELMAIETLLEIDEHDGPGNGLRPSNTARMEMIAIVATRMKEKGQLDLDLGEEGE